MIHDLIQGFDPDLFRHFLRTKFPSFAESSRSLRDLASATARSADKPAPWAEARQLGIVKTLPGPNPLNQPLLVAAALLPDGQPLKERSSRLRQFEFARRALEQAMGEPSPEIDGVITQGLFVFYDTAGNFRLSLVHGKAQGARLVWNSARRLSFYVEAGAGNRTFLDRMDLDWATFDKLKDAFSVEKLTKEFYNRLFAWYQRAMAADDLSLPNDIITDKEPDEVKSEQFIRLITRLMFVWFIKQKQLVPDALFDPARLQTILRDFSPMQGESYYRAILQNLFFATLNSEIGERAFAVDAGKRSVNVEHFDIKTLYRYGADFAIPQQAVLDLFRPIPFLNGGLFECLDRGAAYFDGFSREQGKQARIPNRLFFHETDGLVTLLSQYNFTIEENAPGDEDVALDPELLGKVFENLLGAYNPETKTAARNATGSFYTPREIVNYMVDESLIAHLRTHVPEVEEVPLRDLMGEGEEINLTAPLCRKLVDALFHCRILDPACGSGAFPMGMLLKMVHLLRRLDPDNSLWNEIVLARTEADLKAAESLDAAEKSAQLKRVTDHFDQSVNEPDYTRKLYLIEYCLFGVDIQPIAVQIAKLRAFITLVCDQQPRFNDVTGNYGMLPLPNLETKFVAADSLIGLPRGGDALPMQDVETLKRQLWDVRHKHFRARTYREKKALRRQDKTLREKLAKALERGGGFDTDSAHLMAAWDPYDQNTSASFFDPEWMFNVKDGFDIVIGNPPYGVRFSDCMLLELAPRYETFTHRGESYVLFVELAVKLLTIGGKMGLIIPDTYLNLSFTKALRAYLLRNAEIREIVQLPASAFDTAIVDTTVLMLTHNLHPRQGKFRSRLFDKSEQFVSLAVGMGKSLDLEPWTLDEHAFNITACPEQTAVLARMEAEGLVVNDVADIFYGIKVYQVGKGKPPQTRDIVNNKQFTADRRRGEGWFPFYDGKDVKRYALGWKENNWLHYGPWLAEPRTPAKFEGEKLLIRKIVGDTLLGTYISHTSYCNTLLAVVKLRPGTRFDYKPLLGILNSKLMGWYVRCKLQISADDTFPQILIGNVRMLPLPPPDFEQFERIETLVDRILAAKKADPAADTSALEAEIDRLVYRLYDLTPEEIDIVEGAGRTPATRHPTPGGGAKTLGRRHPTPGSGGARTPDSRGPTAGGARTPDARPPTPGLRSAPKKRPRKPTLPPSREGWS